MGEHVVEAEDVTHAIIAMLVSQLGQDGAAWIGGWHPGAAEIEAGEVGELTIAEVDYLQRSEKWKY